MTCLHGRHSVRWMPRILLHSAIIRWPTQNLLRSNNMDETWGFALVSFMFLVRWFKWNSTLISGNNCGFSVFKHRPTGLIPIVDLWHSAFWTICHNGLLYEHCVYIMVNIWLCYRSAVEFSNLFKVELRIHTLIFICVGWSLL